MRLGAQIASIDGVSATAPRRARRWLAFSGNLVWYVLASALALLFMGPFFWAVSSSLKTPPELTVYPPTFWPRVPQFSNYGEIWRAVPFFAFTMNSVIVGVLSTLGQILSAAAVAYGFARYHFPGRDLLFLLLLSTLVLPTEVTIIPLFLIFKQLGWLDTFLPLIVPQWLGGSAFFIFLMRQFLMMLPRDLDEAAEIDGAGDIRIFWNVLLPLSLPALATCAIFAFLFSWNDFIKPLIFLNSTQNFTLPLGLRFFTITPELAEKPREHLLMGASILTTIPCIAIFFSLQRYFVKGIVMSGIKG